MPAAGAERPARPRAARAYDQSQAICMTPRATDWGLAALVSAGLATGGLTLYAGAGGDAWVYAVHGAAGFALAGLVTWKLRRVWPRVRNARLRDRYSGIGIAALVIVIATLGFGIAWSSGVTPDPLGFSLLAWHEAFGATLIVVVAWHSATRLRLPARGNPSGRRDFLRAGVLAASAYGAWRLQPAASGLVGLRSAKRRFTGSYEAGSFTGNAFPSTSWVADRPRELNPDRWSLRIDGLVEAPVELRLPNLDLRDELTATLDCTGGFYSTQEWAGMRLDRLIEAAAPTRAARHVRVVSRTGYRWTFSLTESRQLLLATHVGGEPLSHEHGAPARLVAPGRRGFQWVKWVDRIELTDEPDLGAVASTIWSSFTAAGRGAS
jgi:DMSO/TMAO reductase YedYZ molybdopterin-dependent catalytic subunit